MSGNGEEVPGLDWAAIARAEKALAGLQDDYLAWARRDMAAMRLTFTQVMQDRANRSAHLDHLFHLAHDMKGQGGSFNYPLVTALGAEICRVLRGAGTIDMARLARINQLVTGLEEVLANELSGTGGTDGDRLRLLIQST